MGSACPGGAKFTYVTNNQFDDYDNINLQSAQVRWKGRSKFAIDVAIDLLCD